MTGKLSEFLKTDVGVVPFTVADGGTGASAWYDMESFGRFQATLTASSMETSENIRLQIQQAKTSTGLGATQVKSTDMSGYTGTTATRDGVRRVESLTFSFTTAATGGQTWKINGLTFTLTSDSTANVVASRLIYNGEIGQVGASSRSRVTAIQFSCAINNATFGIPGVSSTFAAQTVTLTIDNPDGRLLDVSTFTSSDAGFVPVSLMGIGGQNIVDVRRDQLKADAGYKFVKVSFSSSALTAMGVLVQRGEPSNAPTVADLTT